ncbi:MAG: alpha/beta hydrolase-fold protein [Balneolaceae bacterium]|nr:alpha/beta hydrolase-fold protein [Balneolaceae bacterium]
MKEEYFNWYSETLGRDIEMLVYGHAGKPVILFPTSKGRYYETKDFNLIDSVRWFIEEGLVRIYCPDSVDALSFYNKDIHPSDRIKNHIWYDQFIEEEVVDAIRSDTNFDKIVTSGASFGGYHAANFAFRHPGKVSHLFAMSANFDIKSFMDGYYDENVYFNNPVDFIPDNNNPGLWDMQIVLGAGEHDICRQPTERMSGILREKGIDHWLDIRPGATHDWPVWREMFPHYLSLL